nr:MAG TPA: hypothetical protein [Caudoviricetes sp.]
MNFSIIKYVRFIQETLFLFNSEKYGNDIFLNFFHNYSIL